MDSISEVIDGTYVPTSEKPHAVGNGVQKLYRFANGYGASVVQFMLPSYTGADEAWDGSYGASAGLWELAVIVWTGKSFKLTYDTPITNDVVGRLTEVEVQEYLRQIEALA